MATNRPDVLDPALLRPGRLDRKIEIPLPNEQSRMDILKIHAAGIAKHGEIDYEAIVKLAEVSFSLHCWDSECCFSYVSFSPNVSLVQKKGFNGADLRNICTEAGMFAIRAERDYVIHEDFMKVCIYIMHENRLNHVVILVVIWKWTNFLQAVRKLSEAKKLESSSHYNADFGKEWESTHSFLCFRDEERTLQWLSRILY